MSPILFSVYIHLLIMRLKRHRLGCSLLNEFYGCLLYADDILLINHTVHEMQMMLRLCDKFASDFDIKLNCESQLLCALESGSRKNVSHCRLIIKLFCMLLNLKIWVFMSVLDSF